ncbi:MAG: hypothetical protein HY583_03275 [Candidatus Omnitrophica bacterium]|nr:hypothetical protein [Candidatus Omnitrophota bacterium]
MKAENRFLLLFLGLISIAWYTSLSYAAYEKDPIKNTQSNVVPVTQELLTREGEPAPASPTFKMSDTSRFLVKEPYEVAEEAQELHHWDEESALSDWDSWFSWEEGDEGSSDGQLVDKT